MANRPSDGLGHAVRTSAVCRAWEARGNRAILVVDRLDSSIAPLVAGLDVRAAGGDDAESLRAVLDGDVPAIVIVDGYRFSDALLDDLRQAWSPVIVSIDDHATASRSSADIAVDPNAGATRPATLSADAIALLGERFTPLRPEFSARRACRSAATGPIVVALGGSAAADGSRALGGLIGADLGPMRVMGHRPPELVSIPMVDDPARAIDDLVAAPFVIAAAGSTAWELACLGVPMLLVTTAENQVPVARAIDAAGAGIDLGPLHDLGPTDLRDAAVDLIASPDRRAAMSIRGRALVDGLGARRIAATLDASTLDVRPVTIDDAELLLSWRNDPVSRANSFRSDPVTIDEHVRWLTDRLADPDSLLLVVERDGVPVGQVRFHPSGENEVEIGVVVAPECRGLGLGAPVIVAGSIELLRRRPVARILARIKAENSPSIAAFDLAGYVPLGVPDPDADVVSLHCLRSPLLGEAGSEQGR